MTNNSQYVFYYSSLIGYFYQHGIGCEIDEDKALEIFSNAVNNNRKAKSSNLSFDQKNEIITCCNDDDIKKLNEIILQYFYSLFLYEDIILCRKASYKLHIKTAKRGDNVSQYYIGDCYFYGKSIERDLNKAVKWYSKSSKGGNIKAMYKLGGCYEYGDGIMRDKEEAFKLYLKSADGGYKDALYDVGNCYNYGNYTLKDDVRAFEFYLKAAEKGDSYCQYLVSNYYYDGKYIPRNEEKGFYWNREAAINGDVDAQYKLAEFYLNNSINKNENKAFRWYLKLAEDKGYLKANYLVAKCYRDGIGIDKNLEAAKNWIKKHESSRLFLQSINLNDFLNGSDIDLD
ncbi:hypothetical protein RclHR1_01300016 [Rhizophagus clarus]|uniref:Sel1-like repeat protein n=1 Tax=Rhizophagus clarus TaxID=94130 RepID=A0A2Z6QPI7_9GLOM|nr:hypothetical protein RclHR1_01300016 [Rhizophagus clarus]GES95699.1 Sel1-like repeat protein [Rhizophagus clarus]